MPFPRKISLMACAVFVAACGPVKNDARVSGDGFGPVQFGMKVDEAEKALGVKLEQDNYTDDDSCRYFTPVKGFAGLAFMTANGIVVRVDVAEGQDITTDTGAKIGDSEQRVLDLYKGRVRVEPHFYGGLPNHYLKVLGAKGETSLVFETDGAKVTNYRAGREPQVQYVEGCS